jgi:outer membrane protein
MRANRSRTARALSAPALALILGASAALAVATAGWPAVAAAGRGLTVEDAVALALRTNPRLASGRDRQRAAAEVATSVGRRMMPIVRLNEEYQAYNAPFAINFAAAAAGGAGGGAVAGMGGTSGASSGITVREQLTNTFVASAAQPVLGLFRLNNERLAQAEGAAAAEAQLSVSEADVREAVETQFLRFFEAQALEQIAQSSVRELADQVTVAKARLASGVITQADLLRIEVAVANAHQQGLQAHSQAEVARAQLFAAIGLPPSEASAFTLLEPVALLAVARQPSRPLGALLPEARLRRPEVAQQLHLTRAAERQADASGFALLPDIDLEAAYTRVDGQIFAPPNSAFVGVRAQWAIWEWGATWHQRNAALAQASAARRDAEAVDRGIELEIEASVAEGDAARGAVDAADKAISSAEEAYRVTEAQVKAGTATTTDLLEAQSALTQARLNLTRAQYELALSHVSLVRAAGGSSTP